MSLLSCFEYVVIRVLLCRAVEQVCVSKLYEFLDIQIEFAPIGESHSIWRSYGEEVYTCKNVLIFKCDEIK